MGKLFDSILYFLNDFNSTFATYWWKHFDSQMKTENYKFYSYGLGTLFLLLDWIRTCSASLGVFMSIIFGLKSCL